MLHYICRKMTWRIVAGKLGHLKKLYTFDTSIIKMLPFQNTSNSKDFLNKKFINLRHWYEEFTGLDEVKAAQDRVLDAEKNFIASQDLRRAANSKVTALQNRLREIYSELDTTRRGEQRYVSLITQEHKLLKEEEMFTEEFQRLEREEREYFSHLSSALKDSHEKERLQAERTKYWSIIGSILGTIIGIVGSSINNEFRMRELRRLLTEAVSNNQDIDSGIESRLNQIILKLNINENKENNENQHNYRAAEPSEIETVNVTLCDPFDFHMCALTAIGVFFVIRLFS